MRNNLKRYCVAHRVWWVLFSVAVVGPPLLSDRSSVPNAVAEEPKGAAYDKRTPVDPVAVNGAIFADWPKPDLALLLSGEQDGYLEPCGCAGLENQKGGLKRRFTLIKQLRGEGWPVVPLDLGDQAQRTGPQAEIKFGYALRGLMEMGYQAVGLGPHDLRLDLLGQVLNIDEKKNPLVSANVAIVDFDSGFTKRYKIIEAGGMKIGMTTVLDKKQFAGLQNAKDLKLVDPKQAIPEVLPALRNAKCDHLVLLSFADLSETKELARRYPEFDLVVTAHGADEPPNEPKLIEGTQTPLVEVGHKGMYVVVLGLYKNGPPTLRYQRVPLDSRFADATEMQKLLVDYQRDVESLGLDGLGLKPTLHPSGRKFAGSQACADCHTAAFEIFTHTPHSHATDTLVKLDPPRHFDPECLSCHATGWDPQKYYPYTSGFLGLKETPKMVGNGCENCHGPAAQHVAAESGDVAVTDEEQEQLRAALRLKVVENEGNKEGQKLGHVVDVCMQCHDLDNSPEFDFQTYWPKVKHAGKD